MIVTDTVGQPYVPMTRVRQLVELRKQTARIENREHFLPALEVVVSALPQLPDSPERYLQSKHATRRRTTPGATAVHRELQ